LTPTTRDEIAHALAHVWEIPAGPARAARVEQLVEAAAATGDRPLLVRALQSHIQALEYSGENDRILVPFARVLKLWDDNPADFDQRAVHSLFWHFKWVTGGMIDHASVPLSTMEGWLREMATRYAQAGHGMRAVHSQEHYLAAHVGDADRARSALDAWLATDRDEMADCHACERGGQGDWYTEAGDDAAALDVWRPVLDGELGCAEEPHRILAKSLLPLLRQGRTGEARANHLRGYPMARHNPSLRTTVARHLEFAALTGNEPRALEILGEHAAWLTNDGESPLGRLAFLEATAVLLRRLVALGRDDLLIPTPRADRREMTVAALRPLVEAEIAEIGARYDRRNGTTAVSDRSRAALDRAPLLDHLPLGLAPTAQSLVPPAPAEPALPAGSTVDELVAVADDLTARRHPHAEAAWERVARTGADLPARVRAEVAQSRAVAAAQSDPTRAREDFLAVADLFAAAGNPGRAVVNRARAALAASLAGDTGTGGRESAAALAEATALHGAGTADDRDFLVVGLCAAQDLLARAAHEAGPDPDDVVAAVTAVASDAQRLGQPYQVGAARLIEARARLAGGDHDAATAALEASAEAYLAAGTPWEAATPLTFLADVRLAHSDAAGAERAARDALRSGGALVERAVAGRAAAILAQALWQLGGHDAEVVDRALDAAARLEQEHPDAAARARLLAAQAFGRQGRHAEAAALFEAVLPDIDRTGDDEEQVRVRRMYGLCLLETGEPATAAKVLLAGAEKASSWPNQTAHAMLAHDAGQALERSGRHAEAAQAYRRAAGLWELLDRQDTRVRALRATAWALDELDDAAAPVAVMDEAVALAEGYEGDDPGLRAEHAETLRQASQLLVGWASEEPYPAGRGERALALAEESARRFTALGDANTAGRAQVAAAEAEVYRLDRPDAALRRLRAAAAEADGRDDTDLAAHCRSFADWVEKRED
jgi:tetratricopeptide (TPR) repeat protein